MAVSFHLYEGPLQLHHWFVIHWWKGVDCIC